MGLLFLQVQIFHMKSKMKRRPSNPDGLRDKMETFFRGKEKSGGRSRLFNPLGTGMCEFRLHHESSTVEGSKLSSLLCVPKSLTAGYYLMSGVFRACWIGDEAGAKQVILPDRLFVSDKEQGSAVVIAHLPNSLPFQGAPGHMSWLSSEIRPGHCSGMAASTVLCL